LQRSGVAKTKGDTGWSPFDFPFNTTRLDQTIQALRPDDSTAGSSVQNGLMALLFNLENFGDFFTVGRIRLTSDIGVP
jgi:hypothetical protein